MDEWIDRGIPSIDRLHGSAGGKYRSACVPFAQQHIKAVGNRNRGLKKSSGRIDQNSQWLDLFNRPIDRALAAFVRNGSIGAVSCRLKCLWASRYRQRPFKQQINGQVLIILRV